ncbi:HlyD family secretion protein [Ferrimonas marina]|uniref:Multidrug resistance efflux pump n=1 Tax=Ferrimonas marina TaxID=299255 RepID=A0A1M5Z540_9GAMM|nr:biotin/lipoyl-binding protein [Ferrimonas marina]SHI19254.1 Multidrug resistance efflux pump [Ferrimonas marina]
MKEIMLPYILVCWVLVKTGVVRWTLANAVRMVGLGALLAFSLFTASRYWSPVDLTNSTTVKAPQTILSPLVQARVDQVYVDHNQKVKAGDLLYTLEDDNLSGQIQATKAQKLAVNAQIDALAVQRQNDLERLDRRLNTREFVSDEEVEDLRASIAVAEAQIASHEATKQELLANKSVLRYEQGKRAIYAPHDGQISTVNINTGSLTGNMHLYDLDKRFLEMRLADQAYGFVRPGQFAEFYVDAYPGHVFRAKVHSIRAGTGEAAVRVLAGDTHVRQHVGNNAGNHGRTVILEFYEPEGFDIPIGATGAAWISADKPHSALGFMDIIGAAIVRLQSMKAYLNAL